MYAERFIPWGPGSILKEDLAAWGFKERENCNCGQYARMMDLNGPQWCLDQMDKILGWMKQSAHQRKLPFSRLVGKKFVKDAVKKYRAQVPDLRSTFDAVYCVNLNRRKDRWTQFTEGVPRTWPFGPITRSPAVDGKLVRPPSWWRQGNGAWGCYRSHLRLIEDALNRGLKSILLLEDDAIFGEDFATQVQTYLAELPEDWGMVYLGGQHLFAKKNPPLKVSHRVYVPWNVNRTHAFGLRGKTMGAIYQHLTTLDWQNGNHVDHHLGRFTQRRDRRFPVYCPDQWLVGQREGKSNVSGREVPTRFWMNAQTIADVDPATLPFIAVLGLHSSGSSALAGTLWGLGLHLGNNLKGFYGSTPGKSCGYEAEGLMGLCEQAIPFPSTDLALKPGQVWARLRQWITGRKKEAHQKKTLAAGKYPQLCRMGNQLRNVCGSHLRVLVADRPLEESIQSLIRRCPDQDPQQLEEHQRWLFEGREELIQNLEDHQVHRVNYADLLADPEGQVRDIAQWLDLNFQDLDERIQKAVDTVNPDKRHIFS